ncbi:MAG: hypothetical protein V4519_04915 [Patescibacteria group bacterium]
MEDPKKSHSVEDLEQKIYEQKFTNDVTARSGFSHPDLNVNTEWQHEQPKKSEYVSTVPQARAGSFFKKIFIISVLFFVISAGAAAFVFYGGFNIVSSDKVNVEFVGPVSVGAGDELAFDVIVDNQNATPLLDAQVYIDYPNGTKNAVDITQDLLHTKEELGDVAAKTQLRRTVRAILFGQVNDMRDINITLEYGVNNSNGLFKKEKTYKVAIVSTPLTITVNNPPEVPSGQELTFSIDVVSNTSVPIDNLIVRADYPFGFEVVSASPVATFDTNIWKFDRLKPGEKQTITITGRAEGEENDERIFRFTAGTGNAADEKAIVTTYLASSESVFIKKPPLAMQITLEGSTGKDVVIAPSTSVGGTIRITNNNATPLIDGKIMVTFSGSALNPQSPNGRGALYNLTTKTLTWDRTTYNELDVIDPGEMITVGFNLGTLSNSALAALKNGTITMKMTSTASTVGAERLITSVGSRNVKVQSLINLSPRLVYSIGPFKNSGPIPMRADQKTTYTVYLTLSQPANGVREAEVRGFMPSSVRWVGTTSPSNENITFIPERNEVVWRVGDIPAGEAGKPSREVAFQVEYSPVFSQINSTPVIMDDITFKGIDVFTSQQINVSGLKLNSSLIADPNYSTRDGPVRP